MGGLEVGPTIYGWSVGPLILGATEVLLCGAGLDIIRPTGLPTCCGAALLAAGRNVSRKGPACLKNMPAKTKMVRATTSRANKEESDLTG